MARFLIRSSQPSYSSSSDDGDEESGFGCADLISSPLIVPGSTDGDDGGGERRRREGHVSVVEVLVAALRRSLVMCSVGAGEDGGCSGMEIGWPTEVRHVAHVTFDRFDGFLGLPVELEPEVPRRVPSASVNVFGVSAESMQCSYDNRGNSVPTILLSMQRHLYSQGGLQAEGIFRINAENGQEVHVREQLNTGVVPEGIDLHCLAGLIKAWFRELPSGVLDSLTPDQVMHCNTEEECSQLVRLLPPTEAALLDWAINLMADVVEHERNNKMNARNIAMVFAPNMTQMADPLTALIHAVQVMNFLKTLIMKTLREREEAAAESTLLHSCSESPTDNEEANASEVVEKSVGGVRDEPLNFSVFDGTSFNKFLFGSRHNLDCDPEESFHSFDKRSEVDNCEFISGRSSSFTCNSDVPRDGSESEFSNGDAESMLDRFRFREGIRKLCRHPVFQLNKSTRKPSEVVIVCSGKEG